MAKAVREAVPLQARQHCYFLFHFRQGFQHFGPHFWVVSGVQREVEQSELQLTQNKHRRLEVFRRQHFIEHGFRQWLTRLVMTRNERQRLFLPAPVFQELAWQLDCIPRHTIDAGYRAHFHLRQHMVNAVTKFVEQSRHFVVGKQRRLIADWAVEVTRQVSHWCLQCATVGSATYTTLIHPRATAFVFTRIQVEIEAATQRSLRIKNIKKAHRFVPYIYPLALFDLHAKQTAQHFKQAIHYFLFWEVRAQLFIGDFKQMLLLLFAVVSNIPQLKLLDAKLTFGKLAQLFHFTLTLWFGFVGEII
ncbi:Uncharacterised protein [Vibrio cholerae]|uniref:Uncharacterized protein n=1 Tax=Vibrio cholerae TaxID=666 RepID=A0A655Z0G3_VIBCL|nr:Uncharacterised protein [Vibrio cholerae]CSA75729.1 Uncharacterised protein [Vibrio cholerae]CSB09853.1 Uncharacterised protein [Vibrio cholerae]CSB52424.1 Uncharacterised protein [Vibrio cholerae]CSB91532.1 Uncharacterised protein [Vibrio cholerae]